MLYEKSLQLRVTVKLEAITLLGSVSMRGMGDVKLAVGRVG
jgi:hypothetical protein